MLPFKERLALLESVLQEHTPKSLLEELNKYSGYSKSLSLHTVERIEQWQYSGENTQCCPYCGGTSATASITERYDLSVDFTGSPYGQSNNEIVSGGKRFICDTCGRDVSKFIATLEIMK